MSTCSPSQWAQNTSSTTAKTTQTRPTRGNFGLAKVGRYVMISAMGADAEAPDDAGEPVFVAYLRAKGAADDNVRARKALESTIVRPGLLTNDPGTGRVRIADDTGRGSIPREDVAAVLLAVLDEPGTGGQTFEVISGDTPITDYFTTSAHE